MRILAPRYALVVFVSALHLQPSTSLAQGSLTPPGAPAAMFKTLQQIEPRIDLQNAPATAVDTSDASYHFIINQPGSYYLSANLGVTKTNGIQINAAGVTLDLNGFEVFRASGSGGNGIEISVASHRAAVRNGSIRTFAAGVIAQGVSGQFARGCSYRDLSASGCSSYGILAGSAAVLESCLAHDNSGIYGIYANPGSSLTNCRANNNTGYGYAIFANIGSSLTNCSAFGNTGVGISAGNSSELTNCSASSNTGTYGIVVGAGSTLSNCTASSNSGGGGASGGIYADDACTLRGCTARGNTSAETGSRADGMGFSLSYACIVQNCTASGNQGDGMNAARGSSTFTDCNAYNNGFVTIGGTGSGIVGGSRTTVTNCAVTQNKDKGIWIVGVLQGSNGDSSAVVGCTVLANNSGGIVLGNSSTIRNCTIQGNLGDGITVNNANAIISNLVNSNGNGAATAGIHILGSGNRADSNEFRDNNTNSARGLKLDLANAHNVVIRNTAGNNGVNYDVNTGNGIGPIISADAGNMGNASNSPFANIQD